jgi:O-methyltransferase
MSLRSTIKKTIPIPWPLLYVYRKVYYFPKDATAVCGFIFHRTKSPTTFGQRLALVWRFYVISYKVDCPHTENELITIARTILNLGPDVSGGIPGVIVEAGAFHGGSTAKLSLVCRLAGRQLTVFDSFEGMPQNNEAHGKSIFGREHHFPKGSHAVSLEEVKRNVETYGDISRCRFFKGWFSQTMPSFKEPVALACINADLVQSTKDCLKNLYPLVSVGGLIFSQDGHFPWIIELLRDDSFWKKDIGIGKPRMENLGTSKLVAIFK